MPGPVFLRGGGVTLRPVEESDYEFLQRHANHPEVRPGFGNGPPVAADDLADRIEGMADDDGSETFLVCAEPGDARGDEAADAPARVGEAFLFDLHPGRESVEIGYWIAPAHQGSGYATAAAELLVDYCFAERRLHKVNARVLAFNGGSRAVLEKVGFESEGRRRETYYVEGEYVDVDLYGIVEDEWDGPTAAAAERAVETTGPTDAPEEDAD
ncbi:MAG: GNAT family N-acetyltransferase [Halosimplex sp.]